MSGSPNTGSESAPAGMTSTPDYSEKENKLLSVAMRSVKQIPEINWDRFEKYGGFKTRKTAQNNWWPIKKKLEAEISKDETNEIPTQSPTKKRDVNAITHEVEADPVSPSKKAKARRSTKKAADDDENQVSIKPEVDDDMVV